MVKLLSQIPEASAGETRVDKEGTGLSVMLLSARQSGDKKPEVRDEVKVGRVESTQGKRQPAQLNAKAVVVEEYGDQEGMRGLMLRGMSKEEKMKHGCWGRWEVEGSSRKLIGSPLAG